MTLEEICNLLSAKFLTINHDSSLEVQSVFSSDMMSEVLAFAKDESLLVTGLCNPQVIRTAEMMDFAGVVFVHSKEPDETMLSLAEHIGLCMMVTDLSNFTVCGKLSAAGLNGGVQ